MSAEIAASPRLPPPPGGKLTDAQGALAAQQSAAVQIENQILGWRLRLCALHAGVGLIESVSAHAEISRGSHR